MKQLRCKDLRAGDIMLKANDGSAFARAITLTERLVGQANPLIMHAGVMFDPTFIIEAQNSGISANDLRVGDLKCGYMVYRAKQDSFAKGAGTCAKMMFDIQGRHNTLKYNFLGLPGAVLRSRGHAMSATSMDQLLDDILSGKGHPFFCSQFVVYVYQFVAEQNGVRASQVFNVNDARISPSRLASLLQGNSWFGEAGYVLPNER
jgi:hypothetical protein